MIAFSKNLMRLSPFVRAVTQDLQSLQPSVALLTKNGVTKSFAITGLRGMSHGPETMHITPSRWQWHKYKDLLHFYVMLGVIPLGLAVTLVNIFVGPATLQEIPEDYVPKHWEYYRHPITRFIARYITVSPQQDYEKMLHCIVEEEERIELRKLERKIREKMAERGDYQSYYYLPVSAKYHRVTKQTFDELENLRGDM